MTQVLCLNDWELSVHRDGQCLYAEPAAVWEHGGEVQFGEVALTNAQTHPRTTNTNYLVRLNADPLSQPFKQARNHADLLYLQLQALVLREPTLTEHQTVVLVPPATTSNQLGLLLGIAREVSLPIAGFADAASASTATVNLPPEGEAQFLELYLHGAQSARVNLQSTEVVQTSSTEHNDASISTIVDGWANVIADQFVQTSRFDPLHAAATEQQLYNLVFDWFGSPIPDSYVAIDHNNETRRLELSLAELDRKLTERTAGVLQALDRNLPLVLGPNAAETPLLTAALENAGIKVTRAHNAQLVELLNREAQQFDADDVHFVKRYARAQTASPAAAAPSDPVVLPSEVPRATTRGAPTHGLHATTAYRFGSPELPSEAIPADADCGSSVTVNGRLFTLIEVRD